MIVTQIIITLFIIFAISRVLLRFKEGKLSLIALAGWLMLWMLVELAVWIPSVTTGFARIFGIGRGADLIIYASIIVLFYLVFRIYVKLEDIERQITQIVRKIALEKASSKKKSSK